MSYISNSLIDHVSKSVSQTTISEISSFQTNIRRLLEPQYDTFLQGSYANDTAISDINDVDIVALERTNGNLPSIGVNSYIFSDIKSKLEMDRSYLNRIIIGRKCLTVQLVTRKADITPAVSSIFSIPANNFNEPISIVQNIANFPKTHKYNGQVKNQSTNNNYKKIVRMLKNYINNWNIKNIAPSFHIECMIFSYPNNWFSNDLALSLQNILNHMVGNTFNINFVTVAQDKPVVSQTGWQPSCFFAFKQHIINNISNLNLALTSNNDYWANYYFRMFFNIQSRWV